MNAVILENLSKIYKNGKKAVDSVSVPEIWRSLRLSRSQWRRKNYHG